jgi:hypothetical protein
VGGIALAKRTAMHKGQLASLVLALMTATFVACSGGTDTGSLLAGRGNPPAPGSENDDGTGPTNDSDPTEPPETKTPATGEEDGGTTSGDASGPSPFVDAFLGAPVFQSVLGPTARRTAHNFPGNTPTTNPANQACASCHPGFSMGGTVFKDAQGTIPAAGIEVRVRDATGNALSAYTDSDGNFYLRKPAASTFNYPAHTAVRDATKMTGMVATIANGNCASAGCHVVAAAGPIHL